MSWRSKSGEFKLLDGEVYRKVMVKGKPLWVHLSGSPDELSKILLRLLVEATNENRRQG